MSIDDKPTTDGLTSQADTPVAADGSDNHKGQTDAKAGHGSLTRRMYALKPGHASSPFHSDGTRKPAELSLRDLDETRPLTDEEHAEHVRDVRERLDKARADGLETHLRHTLDPDHEQWTDERTLQHDTVIADLYAAASDVPCERRAILAGGLSGAGKTTVLQHHAGIDRSQYLTINPDDIKAEMARRGMVPKVHGLTAMEATDLVHEESSHIAKRLASRAMREGKNIIWDITMSSHGSTERRITDLRSVGYLKVDGIFVDIPVEVSIRRADARHRDGHDRRRAGDGLGGRIVPDEIISAQFDSEKGSRNRETFEQVKPLLDAWSVFDNSVEGRAPLRIESDGTEEEK